VVKGCRQVHCGKGNRIAGRLLVTGSRISCLDVKIVNRYWCCWMWYLLVLRTVRVRGAGSRSRFRRVRILGSRAGESTDNVRPGIKAQFTFADRSE